MLLGIPWDVLHMLTYTLRFHVASSVPAFPWNANVSASRISLLQHSVTLVTQIQEQ